ncbi:MAG: TIGR04165 family Cys-rich peptide [Methanobacterium sp.]|uniref:TIGR04165 family Cys-rich peptide n=1 Tax=Methanobacterium sp. TaxID=2164 RepID=UPI003D653608|nr:TIGR04165 family Cys-rich peptide [Methanobacterium sp.]
MNIGNLSEECPKCGCMDKTIKRDIEREHRARATTGAVLCSECGHEFKSREECQEED